MSRKKQDIIENTEQTEVTLQDFVIPIIGGYAPLTMMLAYVRFEFPLDVKYPCIPVNVEGIPIIARVEPTSKAQPGDKIKIALESEKIHIFDPETEKTITN